jgi:hypothetical protein
MSQETITKEFCAGKKLLFTASSIDEAEFIKDSLSKLGFRWPTLAAHYINFDDVPQHIHRIVENGLILCDGKIEEVSAKTVKTDALVCSSNQFDPPFEKKALASDNKPLTIPEMFNQISAKIEALTNEVQALKEEISFQSLGSNGMKPAKKTR